jgi:hypothetical protein
VLDLVMARDPDDRRHMVLPGVGEARVSGFWKPIVTLHTSLGTWTFGGKLGLQSTVEVFDPAGVTVAVARIAERRIELGARVLRLEGGTSGWVTNRSDVLLLEGDRLLARYEPVPWGNGHQRVAVDDRAAVEDGLLILLASNAAGYWSGRAGMSGAAGGISQ